jgi:hypothetical protein
VANSVYFSVSILLGKGDGSFLTARNYDVGSNPQSVAVGDFNGDGSPDLAVANSKDYTVSILLGKGDGTFQAARSYTAGGTSVAVGDFNGDRIPDLAVADQDYSTVSVLLGNGDGTFQVAEDYLVVANPVSVAVGDFNGDGVPDLTVANYGSGTVSVLLGKGDGIFQAPYGYPPYGYLIAGYFPISLVVGDFNGDGRFDLAVTGPTVVSVLLGKGDGTFLAAQIYAAGYSPNSVAVGDFNGDGHLDIAVANDIDRFGTVSILLGKGDGTFLPAHSFSAGLSSHSVAVGDFNGDGHLDLAVANSGERPFYSYGGSMSVFLGKGDGTFQFPLYYFVGPAPQFVVVGDWNGDGFPDLAIVAGGGVTVLLNAADWGGGPGAPPPGRPALQRAGHRQPPIGLGFAMVAVSKPQLLRPLLLTATDLPPDPVRQWPVETETGQPAYPEAALPPRPLFTTWHARDALFERWSDPVVDGWEWSLMHQGLCFYLLP